MQDFRAHLLLPQLLLIDDDMVSREVLATVLTLSGFTLSTAEGGEEALKLIEGGGSDPEVILMDTQMPGLSGLPLVEALRERSRARIFAISGSQVPDEVTAAVDGFLLKPFGSEALRKALGKFDLAQRPPADPALAEGELPVLKAQTLASFRESMAENKVREIYTSMMDDLKMRIAGIEAAFGRGDLAEARRLGHSIKGGCAMAGAMEISRVGARIEFFRAAGEAGDEPAGSDEVDDKDKLLQDLHAAFANLERILVTEFPVA